MNITFFIGNGFDRNIGLKTSYNEFIEYYISKKENERDLQYIKSKIEKDKEKWSDAEIELGKFTSEFELMSNAPDEMFYKFYNNMLEALGTYLEEEQKKAQKIIKDSSFLGGFGRGLQNYLKGQKATDRDIVTEIIDTIPDGNNYYIINFNYTNIIDLIQKESTKQNFSVFGIRQYKGKREVNYLVKNIHVHGDLATYMIFGVDNESQISAPSIFKNNTDLKRLMLKKEYDGLIGEYLDRDCLRILNNSDVVYLYGVSLGETDAIWWERIIMWLQDNPKSILIIYSHDINQMYHFRTPLEKEEKIRQERKRFLEYSKFDSKTNEEIGNRIYIDGNNIFGELTNRAQDSQLNSSKI